MRTIQRAAITLVTCAAAIAAAACGSSQAADRPAEPSAAPAGRAAATFGASGTRLDDAVRAVMTAERKISRGRAYDVESDRLRGKPVWEVKVARGVTLPYELDVRADGRQVVRQRRATKADDDVRKLARATVPLAKALRTAADRAKGWSFDEAGIDSSRGRIVWEAAFEKPGGRELEVTVDARTGKVFAVELGG